MRALAILPVLALLAACERSPEVTFKDTSITLPDDPPGFTDLPDLPGRDAVIANCTACHSPSTMLQQPKVSREKSGRSAGRAGDCRLHGRGAGAAGRSNAIAAIHARHGWLNLGNA